MDATLKSLGLLIVVTVQATSLLSTQPGGNLEAASYLQPRREAFSISFVIISNERLDHCCTPVGGIRAWCFANARRQQTSTGTSKPHSDGRVQRRGNGHGIDVAGPLQVAFMAWMAGRVVLGGRDFEWQAGSPAVPRADDHDTAHSDCDGEGP